MPEPKRRPEPGLTVREVARRHRISEDKVRALIKRGELRAINTSAVTCARPRYVILPEALAEFEQRRTVGPTPKASRRPRQKTPKNYFP